MFKRDLPLDSPWRSYQHVQWAITLIDIGFFIAAGLAVGAVPALLQRATIPVTVALSLFALANIAAGSGWALSE